MQAQLYFEEQFEVSKLKNSLCHRRHHFASQPIIHSFTSLQKIIKFMKALENKQLIQQVEWLRSPAKYSQMQIQEIQQENKKILLTLKNLQNRLDKQLQQQKNSRVKQGIQQHHLDDYKIAVESIKNNENNIKNLEKEVKKLKERRQQLKAGLQSKSTSKRYELEKKILDCKADIKKMKLQEKQINKRLSSRENPLQPQSIVEHTRLEEQLRVHSLKYMKILQKHNKIAEQLALAVNTSDPEIHIPEQIYDKELQERQEAQFKEYQGIVKMCTILSKRNDSETNKYNRIYSEKLKDLEKIIVNLGQIDRMIALRQGEIIQGKKNVQLIKFKVNNNQKVDEQFFSISQSQLRKASYSTSRLPLENKQSRDKQFSQGTLLPRKLSKIS